MKGRFAVTAVLALLCLGSLAQAVTIDTVTVGDPGNVGELSGTDGTNGTADSDRICGSVGYTYDIGKYEVTTAQYTDFLNHKAKSDPYGLYNMDSACMIQRSGSAGNYTYSVDAGWANRPVNYVSYWDCLRFANWVNNGQGDRDTETGAYTLGGYNGIDGRTIQRNAGAKWFLPSEDEWYKAAYYKGGGTNAGYWDYPTRSDAAPSNVGSDGYTDPGNHANYYAGNYSIGSPYYRTNVGEFENSVSPYGTFDQGGNVWEWNEAIVYIGAGVFGSPSDPVTYRGLRGGGFDPSIFGYDASTYLHAAYRSNDLLGGQFFGGYPLFEGVNMGFRVAAVPEPESLITLGVGGLGAVLGLRRRKA